MVEIEPSNPSDVDYITKMEKQCFDKHLQYGPSILFNLLNSAKYISLTAKTSQDHKKLVLGCAIGENDQKKDAFGRIVLIIVEPQYQRKNVGTELLYVLETKLNDIYGIRSYELQVHHMNEKAIYFYQKNGYKISKKIRNYYNRKDHAYLMEKISGE